jgi:hypothetical protein
MYAKRVTLAPFTCPTLDSTASLPSLLQLCHSRFLEPQEVQAAVVATGNPAAQRVAIGILDAVVTEFMPATASPMGECHQYS